MIKNRHSIRLKHFDYSSTGYYFVTICTKNRECLLGNVIDGKMILNEYGKIVEEILMLLSNRFQIKLNTHQIMPNHIHMMMIIERKNIVGVSFMKPETMTISKSNRHMGLMNQTPTLGLMIRYLKSKSTYEIHKHGFNKPIWQRNYYEHIIRDENDFNKINEYIVNNPERWDRDKNNPINIKND